MSNGYLLATNLLYKPLSNDSFDSAKIAFFEQQLSGYNELPFDRKWIYLKQAFCDSIPDPNTKAIISEFMDKRLSSTDNEYVLSREKCLDYIERFYFLYQNSNPVFTLVPRAKASLLSLLKDAMTNRQLCEPGRYVRFESIIMEFRADKNWIDVFLQQQRYLIVTELHEAFDRDVHTLGVMQQYAYEKNLGITPLHQLSDVYMSSGRKQSIEQYFERHYEEKFTEYENNVVNNLSQHLLFKLSELLRENQVDISQWDHTSVRLPMGYRIELIPDLNAFRLEEADTDVLYLYLQDIQFQGKQLYAVTHLSNPIPLIEPLKKIEPSPKDAQVPKADFEAIKQRLRDGKYSLDDDLQEQLVISALAERGATTHLSVISALLSWMSTYLKLSDISEIRASFCEDAGDCEAWILKPKQICLAQLERIVRTKLIEAQYVVPASQWYDAERGAQLTQLRLPNTLTLDVLEEISQRLKSTIDNHLDFFMLLNQADVSRVLLKYPLVLLRQLNERADLLTDLPEPYQANVGFMDAVIRFLTHKLERLLEEANRTAAENMLQHLLTIIKDQPDYLDTLPDSVSQHAWIEPLLSQHRNTLQSEKNASLTILSSTPNIPLSQLVSLTQHITPWEFIRVIEDRQRNGLITLPFCNNPSLYTQFCQELPEPNHWSTYAAYKRQLTTQTQNTPATNHLLETTAWFIAYMRYQHHYAYFNSRHDIVMHLKQIKMSLHESFNIMISCMLPISVMMAVVFFVIAPLFGPSPEQKSFSEALELCSSTVFGSKNRSHVTDFMENCGNALRYIRVGAEETFLTACIKKLTSEGKAKALANSILICTRKLQSEEEGSFLGILASVLVISIAMTGVMIYFKNNPHFPTYTLSFLDELKRFMDRLQGTCANTPLLLPANDLPTRCDDIIARLQGLDDPAAHEKSALLAHLWGEAKKELPDSADNQTIAQSLQQKRTIVFQGKRHHLSFLTTAARQRCANTLDLMPGDNTTRSVKTSSIEQLVAPPYVALFKPGTNIEENEPIPTVDMKIVKMA